MRKPIWSHDHLTEKPTNWQKNSIPFKLSNTPPVFTNWQTLLQNRASSQLSECLLSRFSHVGLFATLWTVACQAPLSMGFSRQYWSGLPCPPPGDLHNPSIKLAPLAPPALTGGFCTTSSTWEAAQLLESHFYFKSALLMYNLQSKNVHFRCIVQENLARTTVLEERENLHCPKTISVPLPNQLCSCNIWQLLLWVLSP